MKKLFILGLSTLFLNSQAFAQLPVGEITKLSANYLSPKGTGQAQYINLTDFGEYKFPKIEVENYNGLLIFSVADKNFELDLSLFGVTDAEKINLKDLNFRNTASKVSLDMVRVDVDDPEINLFVNNPSLECDRQSTHEDIKIDLLSNCLKNSSFRISSLEFQKLDSSFVNLISNEEISSNKIDLNSFKLDVRNGRFKGEAKSSVSSGLTIKMEGLSAFKIETNTIEIRLDKAKAGIFNIRGKLFDELKKMESETVIINEPYITIELKD